MSAFGAKETFHARADNVIGKLDLAVPEEPFHLWQFKLSLANLENRSQ
jgi:hypothetical protein